MIMRISIVNTRITTAVHIDAYLNRKKRISLKDFSKHFSPLNTSSRSSYEPCRGPKTVHPGYYVMQYDKQNLKSFQKYCEL